MLSHEEIISQIQNATKIAASTPQEPEKKLRELISPIWVQFLKERQINLSLNIHDEAILANGRADTVFNRLILEYKKPYTIRPRNEKNWKLISQVKHYILELAEEGHFGKERLLGVAFDGDHFLYLKYSKRWIEEEPKPLTPENLDLFLTYLEKLTSKVALIPENLIRDFAVHEESHNSVAANCVKTFYREIHKHGETGETKEHVFFEQWKIQFAEVHGTLEEKKIDKSALFKSYGFNKIDQDNFDVYSFFFSLDSYYALLMKLLSYQVVGYYSISKLTGLPLHDWEQQSSDGLCQKCTELEEGGIFRGLGIRNFLEGDLFSWYVQSWSESIYEAIKDIIQRLNNYDPETMEIAPDETRDILKKLYQHLIPKQIRHDLGEYYTPDWLADRCLNQVNYNGNPTVRILDPACGSGTFPILAIKRLKKYARENNISDGDTLKNIVNNIFGFDLNPLAVISARTNYILAISDLLKAKTTDITIPIYLCDSINHPNVTTKGENTLFPEIQPYAVHTSVGNFKLPASIVTKQQVQQVTLLLEDSVKANLPNEQFLNKAKQQMNLSEDDYENSKEYLVEVYSNLLTLEQKKINGIWARIIKNAFAPLFVGKFDLVVGNPPWVNWESLPEEYKHATEPIWEKYHLFEHTGLKARLGSAKDDISVLMTYVALDKYLKTAGKLCFVITQSLFKTTGGGEGFRRFRLGEQGENIKVLQVDDMVELQPFDSVTNKTAIFYCIKGDKTKYPVEYHVWKKTSQKIKEEMSWTEIQKNTRVLYFKAQPVSEEIQGAWLTARPKALIALNKITGASFYRARAGCCGWLNSVYLLKIVSGGSKEISIENFQDNAKRIVKAIKANLEPDLIFPALRGREIKKWYAKPNLGIIIGQDKSTPSKGMDSELLIRLYPKTYSYFNFFQKELCDRPGYKKYLPKEPFYSIYNFGTYTFSPFKVVWGRVGNDLSAAVIGQKELVGITNKTVIPIETVVFVPFEDYAEANYFCSVINSLPARLLIRSYSDIGTGSFASPHILNNLKIPKFDKYNEQHNMLSDLSVKCHSKTSDNINCSEIEDQINDTVKGIWGLSDDELVDIYNNMLEL